MRKALEVITFVLGGLLIFFFITQLPQFFEYHHEYKFDDNALRKKALDLNINPIPTNFREASKLLTIKNGEISHDEVALGQKLFNDTLLSKNNDISCATCHKLKEGGEDNLPTAIGHNNQKNPSHLNTPTVLNTAFATAYFWNARAKTLEEQAAGPIQAHFEMNMTQEEVVKRLQESSEYVQLFNTVFENEPAVSFENVQKALASYERTLLTRGSLDEFLEGNNDAMNSKAKKGFELFLTKGCKGCHAGTSFGGLSVEKFPLRTWWNEWLNVQIVNDKTSVLPQFQLIDRTFPFENIGGFKGKDNNKLFRVPILRNIHQTSPYFHNGSVKELKEAVQIMGKYQLGIIFTQEETELIVEFLKTLDGQIIQFEESLNKNINY
ncbi:MAG: cytochrome c peroxidase [Arcobacteraceae bacterium]|jgi:cytochrome c peroxidase|nr:cytochrome c peroxidase [Arcobacteraceae bacterium]